MAKKISELPAAQVPNDADMYPVVQSAQTRRQTLSQLRAAITGAWSTFIGNFLLSANQGSAQTVLGLVPQSALTDATAARLLTVGAFGWNGGAATVLPAATDFNTVLTPGFYVNTAGGTNTPEASSYLLVFRASATQVKQLAWGYAANTAYARTMNAGSFGTWEPIIPGAMTVLPLNNSWAVFSGRRAAYRRSGNTVEIEAQIAGGTATNGTTVATLPVGFRPPFAMAVPVSGFAAATPSASALTPSVIINPDGTITCQNCTNTLIGFAVKFSLV